MSGNLYGPDQIRRINTLFPALVNHLRELLAADHTGVGLMRVHVQVETFDSDEMARIFRELSFVSPKEKLALVRAAIYELVAKEPALFIAPEAKAPIVLHPAVGPDVNLQEAPKTFTPATQFKLNINSAESFHGERPADTPPPAPVVTSTHTPKVADQLKQGAAQAKAEQLKRDAAVKEVRKDGK